MVRAIAAVTMTAAAALVFGPATAPAATKTVDMGLPVKAQKAFNEQLGSDVNAFFPRGTTIHVGDSVRFVPAGFHTSTSRRRAGAAAAVLADRPEGRRRERRRGRRFWFNGQDQLGFNPALGRGLFGKSVSYNGSKARRQRPAARRQAQADDGEVHQDRHATRTTATSTRA